MHENTKAGLTVSGITVGLFLAFLIYAGFTHAHHGRRAMQAACIRNLQMIEGAKRSWSLENKQGPDGQALERDLSPYMKNSEFVRCPSGGHYTIGKVSENARCSIPGHTL